MTRRNQAGRFTGNNNAVPPSFDLGESLRRLFIAAEKAGDFSGASSVARVIASLSASAADGSVAAGEDENRVPIEAMTPAERLRLRELLLAFRQLKSEVRDRIGSSSPPKGDPIVGSQKT
jgi:hypothetical protein